MSNSSKTMIKGKDLDLETTIESMLAKLRMAGIEIEEVSWENPVPDVYSVHIRDRDCHANFTNGKGVSRKACLASALGEFYERFSTNFFFSDYYLGQGAEKRSFVHFPNERLVKCAQGDWRGSLLSEELWDFFDPERELQAENLRDGNTDLPASSIYTVPYTQVNSGETFWFPVNLIANLYVSNGMAAGNTPPEARVEALSEILERYVKNKVIAEGICLPLIPPEVVARFPRILGMIEELRGHGYHLRLADASLGGCFPVISVTLINPANAAVFASFGAHPCFEVAFERTIVELLQGRSLDQLDDFHPPTFNLQSVAETYNLEEHFINSSGRLSYDFFRTHPDFLFVDWNYDTDTTSQCTYLYDCIHHAGYEIYIADFDCLGIYSCRILVPGMSEIYGIDDLLWNNKNEGAAFRREILSLPALTPQNWRELLERLEESGHSDATNVSEFIGILPDADTGWASLRIGELKAMLCLALGDLRESLQWIDWCLDMNYLPPEKKQLYRCQQALLHIALERNGNYADYEPGLTLMYGKETMLSAMSIQQGRDSFVGLGSPGLALEGFHAHHALIQAYAKLQTTKRK